MNLLAIVASATGMLLAMFVAGTVAYVLKRQETDIKDVKKSSEAGDERGIVKLEEQKKSLEDWRKEDKKWMAEELQKVREEIEKRRLDDKEIFGTINSLSISAAFERGATYGERRKSNEQSG